MSGAPVSDLNYTWRTVSFTADQPSGLNFVPAYQGSRLTLDLAFENPLAVSQAVRYLKSNNLENHVPQSAIFKQDSLHKQYHRHAD